VPVRGRPPGKLALHPPHVATRPVPELYDHAADPFELENLASPEVAAGARAQAAETRMSALTDELADCAGIEGRDPEPASGHYCR
jgi:hypothetical protein